jgi:hypothetical protein
MNIRPIRALLGAAGLTAALIAGAAGPARAAAPGAAAGAAAGSSWSAPPAYGEPPAYKCTINASAVARNAWIKNPGEPAHLGLLVTTSADIHNPYVFVGCTIRVNVDVVDSSGTVLDTVEHDAFAGAVFDPQGNNKSYTWVTEADIDALDLATVNGLEIRLQNVA